MKKESNIVKTKNGLVEKSSDRKIVSPLDSLIEQPYPLIIDFNMAEKIVQKIDVLVKILKPGKLNENEYQLLNEITSGLRHPSPISS